MACVFVFDKYGAAVSFLPFLFFSVIPAVDDLYAAVIITAVFGKNIGETALERMVQAGDFVPGTEVTATLKTGDWLNTLWKTGAAGHADKRGYQKPSF